MLDFYKLDEGEQDEMYALPYYITILMASADGHIDDLEVNKAIALSKQKNKYPHPDLECYYALVNQNYEDKLKFHIHNIPNSIEQRERFLLAKVKRAQSILNKLDQKYSLVLIDSMRDTALAIAKASGGVFSFGSISPEESRVLSLDLLNYVAIGQRRHL